MNLNNRSSWGFSGMTALLLLSFYVTLTTIPKEGRSLRGSLAVTADTFQGVVAKLGATARLDGLTPLPSDEFFVEKSTDNQLKIAWLMSFPNSGTSYTITLLRHLTMISTATNYGHELPENNLASVPVYADQPTGPFWYESRTQPSAYTRPTKYVLTKTHCGLRCEQCPPQNYVETTFSFRRNCLSGGRINEQGDKELVTYSADKVAKAIHLIRDPFDNVVSRFHLARRKTEEMESMYPSTKEGFLDFCQSLNDAYSADEDRAPFIHQSIQAILQDVPCRADFIRHIEWHNLVFTTTADMKLDTMILHYDSYADRFDETVKELVDFLGVPVPALAEIEPFVPGKVYHEYFTEEQRGRVKLAMEAMASSESWRHIGRYFESEA